MSYVKIPTYVRVGGQLLIVDHQDFLDHNDLGLCSLAGGYIKIAKSFNNGTSQSDTSKCNTFYNELVHANLDTMGENELSRNEKFVNCFAGFLTEAMTEAYFKEDE